MADFTALKTAIQQNIAQNGNKEITGNLLQTILLAMVQSMGDQAINGVLQMLSNEMIARENADGSLSQALTAEQQRAIAAETKSAVLDGETNTLVFKNAAGQELYQVSVASLISSGLVDVEVEGTNLVMTFHTESGEKEITIPISDIFSPSNYYTKTQVDGLLLPLSRAITRINDTLHEGALYAGYATPETIPTEHEGASLFYIATEAGEYTHFFSNGDIPVVIPTPGLHLIVGGVEADDWHWETIVTFTNNVQFNNAQLITSGGVFNAINPINELLHRNYMLAGVADTTTIPTEDTNVFYLAGQGGTYTYFLNGSDEPLVLPKGLTVIYRGVEDDGWNYWTVYADNDFINTNRSQDLSSAQKTQARTNIDVYSKSEVNNLITTPEQGYISVTATDQTTSVTDILPATGQADTIYRVGCWDGTQYDVTVYSEYAWNGTQYIKLTTKEVGIDDYPTLNSDNLVKSDGVFSFFQKIVPTFYNIEQNHIEVFVTGKYVAPSTGEYVNHADYSATDYIDIEGSNKYGFCNFGPIYAAWYDSNKEYITGITENSPVPYYVYSRPENAKYIRISTKNDFFDEALIFNSNAIVELSNFISVNIEQIIGLSESLQGIIALINNIASNADSIVEVNASIVGKFVLPSNGELYDNSDFSATNYISVEAETNYKLISNGSGKLYGAWYDSNKNYISGIEENQNISLPYNMTSPEGSAYVRLSSEHSFFNKSVLSKEDTYLNPAIQVKKSQVEGLQGDDIITRTVIKVKPSGGGDFTTLSAAFDSITDSSNINRYIVEFYGNGEEYDTLNDKPFTGGQGLTVPPFTKLVGVGGKSKNILTRRLPSVNQYDSLLNLHLTSELQGFTLIAVNTRYVVHDDFYRQDEIDIDYERKITDVEAIAGKTYFDMVWGAGIRSGGNWYFENCIFKSTNSTNRSYSCHNNTGFINTTKQKFVNCRFLAIDNYDHAVEFGTLNTDANGIKNLVNFYGCVISRLRLKEENYILYGSGILFIVTGYGNDLKNGSEKIIITNSDEKDYSSNVDLI